MVGLKIGVLAALGHYEADPCLWAVPTRTVRHLPEMVQRSSWSWDHSQQASWAQPLSSSGEGCSFLPAGLRARGQSQACLITSVSSWTLHPWNSERNLGFPLGRGVSLWPQDIITMSDSVIQFKVLEIAEGYVAISVFIAQIECVCHIYRGVPGGHRKPFWRAVSSGIAEDGGRQMWYHLSHNALWKWSLGGTSSILPPAHSLPCADSFAAPVCWSRCFFLCSSATPALALPPPPVSQAAADT